MTAVYGHLPLLEIVLFVDDDASAENGILAVQEAGSFPFDNLLFLRRYFRLSRRDEVW